MKARNILQEAIEIYKQAKPGDKIFSTNYWSGNPTPQSEVYRRTIFDLAASGVDVTRVFIEGDTFTDKEKKQLSNLPAMVYYGVDTDEAILMRKANVPRSISKKLGSELSSQIGDEIYKKTVDDASNWLLELPDAKWQDAVPKYKNITGTDYKRIWQMLSGTI